MDKNGEILAVAQQLYETAKATYKLREDNFREWVYLLDVITPENCMAIIPQLREILVNELRETQDLRLAL